MNDGVSAIDKLIIAAELDWEQDAAHEMLAAAGLLIDLTTKKGRPVNSWGVLYLDQCRAEALSAVREFAMIDATDAKAVLACQAKVKDYMRVAGFVDRLLKQAATAVNELPDDDAGDEVGELQDNAGEEAAERADTRRG